MFKHLITFFIILCCTMSNLLYAQFLTVGPTSTIKNKFYFEKKQKEYSIVLMWQPVANATRYEIEWINRLDGKKSTLTSNQPLLKLEVIPNNYFDWRVKAFKDKNALTNYSLGYEVIVINTSEGDNSTNKEKNATDNPATNAAVGDATNSKATDKNILINPQDLLKGTNESVDDSTTKDTTNKPSIKFWDKAWARAGLGLRFTNYNQTFSGSTLAQSENSTLFHSIAGNPSLNINGGYYFTDKISTELNFNLSSGDFLERSDLVLTDYTWTEFHIEGIYLLDNMGYKTKNNHWHLRLGFTYQSISLLASFPAPIPTYQMVDNNLLFASFGGGYSRLFGSKIRAHYHLNLLYNMAGSTSEFEYVVEQGFGINSLLRVEYKIFDDYKVGVSWQLQYMSIGYNLIDNTYNTEGTQTFMQNVLGLSISYDL